MPRNPDKKRCSFPDCRAWAIRGTDPPVCSPHSGRCLAYRFQHGRRGPGAPLHNLNALRSGERSQPIPNDSLQLIADHVLQHPDDLPYQIGIITQSILERTGPDPFQALVGLRVALRHLLPIIARPIFLTELQDFLQHHTLPVQRPFLSAIRGIPRRYRPHDRLLILRSLIRSINGKLRP